MKKEYIAPELVVESVLIADSAVASYTEDDCVGYDCVTDNNPDDGIYKGRVYMKNGQLYYCYGFGEGCGL